VSESPLVQKVILSNLRHIVTPDDNTSVTCTRIFKFQRSATGKMGAKGTRSYIKTTYMSKANLSLVSVSE